MTLLEIFKDPQTGLSRAVFFNSALKAGFTRREILDFYNAQPVTQIHKRIEPVFNSIVANPGSWAVDITYYNDYAGIPGNLKKTGILTAIEQTARFAWARPINSKSPIELRPLFLELINHMDKIGHPINTIISDDGVEWRGSVSKLFKDNNIKHFPSARKGATARIERFNRTLREDISRYFTRKTLDGSSNMVWVNVLQKIIDGHNNTPSKVTLGYTPQQVLSDPYKMDEVRENDRLRGLPAQKDRIENIAEGATVRILLNKGTFDKKSGAKWSTDLYKVEFKKSLFSVLMRARNTRTGKLHKRSFANWELQVIPQVTTTPVAQTTPYFSIERFIKQKRKADAVKHLLNREGIDTSAIIIEPRRTRGVLPARLRD